jgi:hypothetical protein
VSITREGDTLTITGYTGAGSDSRGTFHWRNNEDRPIIIRVQGFPRAFLLRPGLVFRANNLGGGILIRFFAADRDTEIDVEYAE